MTEEASKGQELEHIAAAYLQGLGYLVRRGVRLSVAAGTAEATDIDVLGIRFAEPLHEHRVVVDCKAKRKPRPFERALWTSGLRNVARANQAIVVVSQAPWQARDFAAQSNVDMVDANTLAALAAESAGNAFGEASYAASRSYETRRDAADTDTKELAQEDLRLRQMLVTGNALTNFNRLIVMISEVLASTALDTSTNRWVREYLARNAAVIGVVMLVRFCCEAKFLHESDRRSLVRKRLTFGDMPPQKAMAIAKHALGPHAADAFPEPAYVDEIVEAVELLVKNSDAGAIAPFVCDVHLIGRSVFESPISYPRSFTADVVGRAEKVVQRLVSAIAYAAEVSLDFWAPCSATQTPIPVKPLRSGSNRLRNERAPTKAHEQRMLPEESATRPRQAARAPIVGPNSPVSGPRVDRLAPNPRPVDDTSDAVNEGP